MIEDTILTPHGAKRVVDWPEFYGGGYDLVSGQRTANKDFTKSPWAFACMVVRGTELANLPWRLVSKRGKVINKHPLIDMLTEFGPESNYSEAIQATEIDMLMYGAAYWLRDVDILKRLNPQTIEVIKTRDGITGFKQTINGKVVNTFSRDDVIYFREYNPDDDLGVGVPVMEIIKGAISAEYEALMYVDAHFKNDATPSLLLTTDQTVPEVEMNRVLLWWNRRFKGTKNKGKVGMVDKGLKAQVLSESLKENQIVEIRDQARNDICVGMRVPKILVGAMQDATYANAQESRQLLIEDVIIPRGVYYESAINQDLVQKVDPNVIFEFAIDELQILQEDATLKEVRLGHMFDKKIISAEYYRAEMGIDEADAPVEEEVPEVIPEIPVLRSWSKKAKKAFKRGENPNVPFETDEVSDEMQIAIRARLEVASTRREIEGAFVDLPDKQPDISITVNVPEQPVTVNTGETVVNVPEKEVTVNVPEQKAPKVDVHVPQILESSEEKSMIRDSMGNATGTKSKVTHRYD